MSGLQTAKIDALFRSIPNNTGIDPNLIEAARTELNELKFKAGAQIVQHKQGNMYMYIVLGICTWWEWMNYKTFSKQVLKVLITILGPAEEPWTKTKVEKLKDELQVKETEVFLLKQQVKELRKGSVGNPSDDMNRPLKIREKYIQVYKHEWSEVFQFFKNKGWNEIEIIVTMQRILRASHMFCHDVAVEQLQNIEGEALYPSATWMDDNAIIQRMRSKDISKEISKLARQYQRTTAQECLSALQKTFIAHILPTFVDPVKYGDKVVHTYCGACVDVTWAMCILDPPMAFVDKIERTAPVDSERFSKYCNNGGTKYDFLVWPALLLHVNGPLVVKGVVQTIPTKNRSLPTSPEFVESPRKMKIPGGRDSMSRVSRDPENWVDFDSDGGSEPDKGVTPPQVYVRAPERDNYIQPSTPYVQPFGRRSRDAVPKINVQDMDDELDYNPAQRSSRRKPRNNKDGDNLTVAWKNRDKITSAP